MPVNTGLDNGAAMRRRLGTPLHAPAGGEHAAAHAAIRACARTVAAAVPVAALAAALLAGGTGTSAAAGNAPGAPGQSPATWAPADMSGFGTSKTTQSKVWFTLQGGT